MGHSMLSSGLSTPVKVVEVHCCIRNVRMLLAEQAFEVDAHISFTYDHFVAGDVGVELGRACETSSRSLLKSDPWYQDIIASVPLFEPMNQRGGETLGSDPEKAAKIVVMHASRRRQLQLRPNATIAGREGHDIADEERLSSRPGKVSCVRVHVAKNRATHAPEDTTLR